MYLFMVAMFVIVSSSGTGGRWSPPFGAAAFGAATVAAIQATCCRVKACPLLSVFVCLFLLLYWSSPGLLLPGSLLRYHVKTQQLFDCRLFVHVTVLFSSGNRP